MSEWLQTYNEMFGMYHAGIITTIFGAFARTDQTAQRPQDKDAAYFDELADLVLQNSLNKK